MPLPRRLSMKRFILVLSLSAGLITFNPVASAQESGAPVINADGTDAASTAGLNPVDNGTGPTLIYGDLSAGVPPVPIASEPVPLVADPASGPDAATTNEPAPVAEPAPEGELAPAPEETTTTTSTEPASAAPASETTPATAPETTGVAPETTTATASGEPAPVPQYDPVTGLAIDPVSGFLIDPASGLIFDRRTGYQVHPMTGLLIEPTTGAQLDPVTLAVVIPAGFGSETPDYDPASGEMRGTIETVVDDNYDNATYQVAPPTDGPVQPIDEIEVPTTAGDAIEKS